MGRGGGGRNTEQGTIYKYTMYKIKYTTRANDKNDKEEN